MKRNNFVDTVDGQAVTSLSHLVELLSSRDGESHRIMLEDGEYEVVLRHEDVDRRSQEILARYRIPADRSPGSATRAPHSELTMRAAALLMHGGEARGIRPSALSS